jgi:hypothetical protein
MIHSVSSFNGVCTEHTIENIIEMVLRLSEEVGHHRKDIEILKTKMKTISATERSSVAYVEDSWTRRDVTSSAASKNNVEKTYQEVLSRWPAICNFLLVLRST